MGAGGLPTREVDRRPGHPADTGHRGYRGWLFGWKEGRSCVSTNLTAPNDTVWLGGLTWKLLRLLLDRHMVHMFMEMVGNRSFTLTTGNDKRSKLRRLKRRPIGIFPVAPPPQHLLLWPANYSLQKLCICLWSSNHACWWWLTSSGRGAEQGMLTEAEYLQV